MTKRQSPTRLQSKELTPRQALVRAALEASLPELVRPVLSLREVIWEAGITPTAFYRHFDDMEELGLVLVEESFQSLGEMLKDARSRPTMDGEVIKRSVAVVVLHMHNHTAHFRFIARERNGGVRRCAGPSIVNSSSSPTSWPSFLVAMPGVDRWTAPTTGACWPGSSPAVTIIQMVAELLEHGPDEEMAIVERTKRQLQLISLGVPQWRSTTVSAEARQVS